MVVKEEEREGGGRGERGRWLMVVKEEEWKGGGEGGREGGVYYLVLLVLGDEVVHVALGLRELHLVHALTRVPRGREGGREGE